MREGQAHGYGTGSVKVEKREGVDRGNDGGGGAIMWTRSSPLCRHSHRPATAY